MQSALSLRGGLSWVGSLRLPVVLFAFVLVLGSCATAPETVTLNCPTPPAPVCKPGSFDKTLLDTTSHGAGTTQTHITALPDSINSPLNDNAITFLPTDRGLYAIVSSDRASASRDEVTANGQRFFAAPFRGTTSYGSMVDLFEGAMLSPLGAGFYSAADHRFYFSAKANNSDPDDYDLYSARVAFSGKDLKLEDVQPITDVNSDHNFDSQPTLDATGTRLYFVSDRPGGMGGTDIWYAERSSVTSHHWSEPRPVGPPINTECDELSPYIPAYAPNVLYFASNGHETVGGYDLFKATQKGETFEAPQNLGKPINTAYDEIFPMALNDTAFFWSSNAPTYLAGRNLFTITRSRIPATAEEQRRLALEQERIRIAHLQQDSVIKVREEEHAKALQTPVDVYVHVTRGTEHVPAAGADLFVRKDSVEIYRGVVPLSGNFLIKVNREASYDFGAETEQTFFDVRHLDLHGYTDTAAEVYLNLPDTLVLRINFPFDDYEHPYEYVIGENGEPTTMTWQAALDLTAHSALRSAGHLRELVVIGHTDSLGTDAYNDRLGFRRATFVAQELEKRGVPSGLVRVLSKGRTEPVAKKPGETDEEYRLRNRRVEFIKVFR